jgi:hypothetical protein
VSEGCLYCIGFRSDHGVFGCSISGLLLEDTQTLYFVLHIMSVLYNKRHDERYYSFLHITIH